MADTIDALATALHELKQRFGDDTFANRRRLISLLSDKFPDAKREVRAIGTAIDENVPAALAGTQRQLVGLEMDRQADRLESSTGLRIDFARQTVRALAFALDLGPLPSVYPASGSLPTPTPAPIPTPNPVPTPSYPSMPPTPAPGPGQGNQWVGVSSPVDPQPPRGFVSYPTNPYAPSTPYNPYAHAPTAPAKPKMALLTKILIGVVVVFVLLTIVGIANAPSDDKKPLTTPTASGGQYGPGDETRDFGVAPQATLQANVGSETPVSIPVGTTLTTADVQRMMGQQPAPQLIDVLANDHQSTIAGAVYLPEFGKPGSFDDATQTKVTNQLASLPAAQHQQPLILFCAGVRCWESYNAVLRANAAGAKNLYWYRGGLQSWGAAGGAMAPLPPAPTP